TGEGGHEASVNNVRFTPKSRHRLSISGCPLCAKSRHCRADPNSLLSLVCASDHRWFPGAIEHCLVGPISAQPDREVTIRRWQPVGLLIHARRLMAKINSK